MKVSSTISTNTTTNTSSNTNGDGNIELEITRMIEAEPIRVIVERHPEILTVLAQYDMDLCCGGGYTIREAARLHDIDATLLREQIEAVIVWT